MNSSDTIVAFDLHSVILKPDWKEIGRILWKWPHKFYLLSCAFRMKFIWKCLTLLFQEPTDEEYFALFQEYCPTLLPLIIDLFNSFKPMNDMVCILKELKTKGYELHIVSNVGPRRFKALKKHLPQVINLFDRVKINNGDVHHLIKKPSPEFFRDYIRDNNPENKQIIFIDDNKHNIKAASGFGIIGIRFTSANQLCKSLKQLGIL